MIEILQYQLERCDECGAELSRREQLAGLCSSCLNAPLPRKKENDAIQRK